MGLNQGYLKAARTEESNEQYTPFYAVNGMTFWTWNATEKRADLEKSRKY